MKNSASRPKSGEHVPSFDVTVLGRALHGLVQAISARPLSAPPRSVPVGSALASYASTLAFEAGFLVDHVEVFEDDLARLVDGRSPFLFVPSPGSADAFAVLSSRKGKLTMLDAVGRQILVSRGAAQHAFLGASRERTEALAARIVVGRKDRLVSALHRELRGAAPVGFGFVFRPNTAESVPRAIASLGLGANLMRILAQSTVQTLLTAGAWALIGSLALTGHADTSSLLGWALVSATATIVQLLSTRFVGRFTMRAATVLRERLLQGALALDPDDLSSLGLGGLMVISGQADGFLGALITFLLAVLGVLTNIAATTAVLAAAPLPTLSLPLFFGFVVGIVAMFPRASTLLTAQQQQRMSLTTDTVERMVGHATRLVQQTPNSWHDGEDESLRGHAEITRQNDRLAATLLLLPRAYYVLAAVSLVFVLVARPTTEAIALSIGGMTLGMATLAALVDLVLSAATLRALWRAIQPIIGDAKGGNATVATASSTASEHGASNNAVELRGVRFRYPSRAKAVLEDVDLVIRKHDRVLIEGPSGGGKTTLAALLTGTRKPDSGLVLVGGLDQHTIQEPELRRAIASAPQFYKNHVFAESLAFNLLLGRAWPPSPDDLREAAAVARSLGLGPLLERMPAGLFQHVGETGWQLSHGEKSRVYLARTLLQRAELLVLDETFGALDPANLKQCMKVVLEQAKTLVVITHR